MSITPPFRAYTGNEHYAFVCYAHADSEVVFPDILWINDSACNIWYDEGIAPSSSWRDEIAETILNAKVFVIYLSSKLAVSEECKKELWFAIDHRIPILTIHIEKFDLPPGLKLSLSNRQAIEKFQYETEAYRTKLKEALNHLFQHGITDTRQWKEGSTHNKGKVSKEIDHRYQLNNGLYREGDWEVYRAIDRLKGKIVTIKRETEDHIHESVLAREFQQLSRLRHPNIVRALDFGIEDDGRQYLVLDLPENAAPLREAAANQPLSVLVDFLSQGLRALHYIHRNGLLHRSINPNSIIVVDGQLKFLNFANCCSAHSSLNLSPAVILSDYDAPEIARGARANESSDLYSLGAVVYQAITGLDNWTTEKTAETSIALSPDLLQKQCIDPQLAAFLGRLMAGDSEQRIDNASEALAALSEFAGSVNLETMLTRESALQMAQFVGRKTEIEHLVLALESAKRGQGRMTFIAGESGVGKSRLLGELETLARLGSFSVVQGHAVEGETGSYRIWNEVIEFFDRGAPVGSNDDFDQSLGLDESSFLRIENALKQHDKPILILLEDLHWAGTESVKLLKWLAKPIRSLSVLIVGSYRPEEAFDPSEILEDVDLIQLTRLAEAEVEELASSILGISPNERLMEFLAHETEGNSLFIIETLRVLAEDAGALNKIDGNQLPEKVLSGGMQRILSRRIARVDVADLEILQLAAVSGRAINPELLSYLTSGSDIDAWAERCSQEAVLEHIDGSYRFSHEKLREYIYDGLGIATQQEHHRCIAEALEELCNDTKLIATILSYHWNRAGNRDKEACYAFMAGEHTFKAGAIRESVVYFKRTEELFNSGTSLKITDLQTDALLKARIAEAYYRLGNLAECYAQSIAAARLMNVYFPNSKITMGMATVLELSKLIVSKKSRTSRSAKSVELSRLQLRLTDIYWFALQQLSVIWSTLRAANESRTHGNPDELARAYSLLGSIASAAKLDSLARGYALNALLTARKSSDIQTRSYVYSRLSMQCITNCQWRSARRRIDIALKIAKRSGEFRLVEEMMSLHALVNAVTGNFAKALEQFTAMREYAHRIGDKQVECWGAQGAAVCLVRLGRTEEARPYAEATLDTVHDPYMKAEAISSHSVMAFVHQRAGEISKAKYHIDEALIRLVDTPPIAHWMQGVLGCLLETVFLVYQGGRSAAVLKIRSDALKSLKTYAKNQTLGQPFACLWNGVALAENGNIPRAKSEFTRGLEKAKALDMPYDAARLQLELARYEQPDRIKLENLQTALENMGCEHELNILRKLQSEAG